MDIIHLIARCPWGRLSLYQKWVPGVFPGSKCGRCVRLRTLPPSCDVVMKSGNLNFLEPSGPLQACNRTALHTYDRYTFHIRPPLQKSKTKILYNPNCSSLDFFPRNHFLNFPLTPTPEFFVPRHPPTYYLTLYLKHGYNPQHDALNVPT
jgi:hypothetical protein